MSVTSTAGRLETVPSPARTKPSERLDRLQVMVAVASLIGVALGAVIAAAAQLLVRRSQRRERWLADLLEQCATVYALEATFRGAANAAHA